MSDLQTEIKHLIIEALGLEDMAAEDIAAEEFKAVRTVGDVVEAVYQVVNADSAAG